MRSDGSRRADLTTATAGCGSAGSTQGYRRWCSPSLTVASVLGRRGWRWSSREKAAARPHPPTSVLHRLTRPLLPCTCARSTRWLRRTRPASTTALLAAPLPLPTPPLVLISQAVVKPNKALQDQLDSPIALFKHSSTSCADSHATLRDTAAVAPSPCLRSPSRPFLPPFTTARTRRAAIEPHNLRNTTSSTICSPLCAALRPFASSTRCSSRRTCLAQVQQRGTSESEAQLEPPTCTSQCNAALGNVRQPVRARRERSSKVRERGADRSASRAGRARAAHGERRWEESDSRYMIVRALQRC